MNGTNVVFIILFLSNPVQNVINFGLATYVLPATCVLAKWCNPHALQAEQLGGIDVTTMLISITIMFEGHERLRSLDERNLKYVRMARDGTNPAKVGWTTDILDCQEV